MSKQINRLTAAFIKEAGPGMYADGGGLWLRIAEGSDGLNRSWIFRYAVVESEEEREQRKAQGKRQGERQMGLGPLTTVDLPTARKLATEKRLLRAGGTDPLAALDAQKDIRRVERAAAVKDSNRPDAPIFDHALDDFHTANEGRWRSREHAAEWKDSLVRHACPMIGGKRVDEITILDVLAGLKPIWKTRAVTAARVRGRIEKVLDRSFVHMHPDDVIAAQKLVAQNPARGHRVVEIGAVELVDHSPTGRTFHRYLNPEREMPADARAVHGLTAEFLADKPLFAAVADEFLAFVGDAPLVAHNAGFDIAFLNAELKRAGKPPIVIERVIDTLVLARRKHAGGHNTLDDLCTRNGVDRSRRTAAPPS